MAALRGKDWRRKLAALVVRDVSRRDHAAHVAALRALKAEIVALRARRREVLAKTRAGCRAARVRARAAILARRRAEHERIRRELAEMRQAERNRCAARVVGARASIATAIEGKKRQAAKVRRDDKADRRIAKHGETERARVTARERLGESDDSVRSNLDAHLVPIFDRVRKTIHASPRMSRTEAFLHWAHEHPTEIQEMQAENSEKEFARLLREHTRQERETERARLVAARASKAAAKCGGSCGGAAKRRAARAALEEAPF